MIPDWYRFMGKPTVVSTKLLSCAKADGQLTFKYNQIGNAVPPLLAYHLAQQALTHLRQHDR